MNAGAAGARPTSNGAQTPSSSMARVAYWPFHPFLFAATSVLTLYANNLREASLHDMAPALGGAVAVALGLYLAFAALLRGPGSRAALLASVWTVAAVFYGDLFGRLNRVLGDDFSLLATLPVALVLLAGLTFFLWRTRMSLAAPQLALNAVAAAMLAAPAWQIASHEWRNAAAEAAFDPAAAYAAIAGEAGDPAAVARGDRPPDIYYLIFDRYASHRTLADHYGADNGALMAFLEERGFYVARESRSNYFKTGHSLASTFHMDYLDFLAEDGRVHPENWRPIHRMLADHRVARFLQERGYEFLQFGAWWTATHTSPAAAENHPYGLSEFNMLYLRRTILRPVFHALPANRVTMQLHWDNGQCGRVARQMEHIKRIGAREKPVFVFAHVLVPHGPEAFARDGRCLSQAEFDERGTFQGYVDQVVYTDAIITDLVTTLLSGAREPPVIIVQSDEGPIPPRFLNRAPSWRDAEPHEIQIKTSIINAYFFPDGDHAGLYQSITPVNSFRLLFNRLFDSAFDLLPDRVWGHPDDFNLYEFFDVTDIVRHRAPPTFPDRTKGLLPVD